MRHWKMKTTRMTTMLNNLYKPAPPENINWCEDCGYEAPSSKYKANHNCKFKIITKVILMVITFIIIGTVILTLVMSVILNAHSN